MGDECSLSAQKHYDFLTYILGLYSKSWSNVDCLIGDNVRTKKCIANYTGLPLIGCSSHRFNLAMRDNLSDEELLVSKVHVIMIKLSSFLLAAQLKRHTYLKPKIRNKTRWSSIFTMLQQYVRLRDVLPRLNSDEIAFLALTPSEDRRIDGLLLQLDPLEPMNLVL